MKRIKVAPGLRVEDHTGDNRFPDRIKLRIGNGSRAHARWISDEDARVLATVLQTIADRKDTR